MKFKKFRKYRFNYACIMTTGRTGSDFLQGCLDGVPGVITFSGELPFFKFIENQKTIEILKKKNSKILIDHFVNFNKNLFYYDKLENKKFNFSINKFKTLFKIIIKEQKLNKKNLLNSLYISYHLAINRKILKKNTLIHHSHNIIETEKFMKHFKNSKLLVTIRNPFQNLKSGINNWVKFDKRKRNFEHFYLYIKRIREDLNYALGKRSVFFVKLEEMNKNSHLRNILNFLNLRYSKKINTSTFAGIPWKSDKLSNFKVRNGKFNNSILVENYENYYFQKDLLILSFLYKKYRLFGYKIKNLNFFEKMSLPFLFIFPMKFELKIIKKIFTENSSRKNIINLYNYLKKILYFYKSFIF